MRNSLMILTGILALALSAAGQTKPAATPQELIEAKQAEQSQALLRGLGEFQYRAKIDIPAVDCIFVEDGKISEGTYHSALKEYPKALAAGAVTKISRVKVMEHAIQIFFATDSCALIAVRAAAMDTAAMTNKELLEMARKSIAPLFETLSQPKELQDKPAAKQPPPK